MTIGLDFYRVLTSIVKEFYEEFKFVDKSETQYNYWYDLTKKNNISCFMKFI